MNDTLAEWLGTTFAEAIEHYNDGRHSKAEALARQVLSLRPDSDSAQHLLGLCALSLGRPDEARAWLLESLRRTPDNADRWLALGMAQKSVGDNLSALESLKRANSLQPERSDILINLANLAQDTGNFEAGLAAYRHALSLAPEDAQIHYNLGLSLLTLGQFQEGWREAEWRWKAAGIDLDKVAFNAPFWKGENLAGGTLLLWAEQGLGDTIMFVRYIRLLAEQGAKVLLQAHKSLHPLLESLEGLHGLFAEGDSLPSYDYQAPLLAVPGRFGTKLDTIPAATPYLHPSPKTVDKWRERLKSSKGRKVGLTWRGNPAHANDRARSIPTPLLKPLLEIEGVDWIGLQPDPGENPPGIFNAGPELGDWGETAGLVANLDLVIAVDSSAAHLAGAVGADCWLLLPYLPDWRWLLGRADSPWYPSMTLWRQPKPGDWQSPISDVARALARRR